MKTKGILILLVVSLTIVFALACESGSSEKESSPMSPEAITKATETQPTIVPTTTPTATPDNTLTPSPSPTSNEPPECEEDRQAIKAALDAYYAANGEWPTANGQPGHIVWQKVVPDLLETRPSTYRCKWQVNSDPLGEVCRSVHC